MIWANNVATLARAWSAISSAALSGDGSQRGDSLDIPCPNEPIAVV